MSERRERSKRVERVERGERIHHEAGSGFQFGITECRYFPKPSRLLKTMELVYINKGQGVCFSGDGITPFRPGELFFFGADTPHYFRSAMQFYEASYPLRCGATYIRFNEGTLPRNYRSIPDCDNIRMLIDRGVQGIKWGARDIDRDLIRQIETMEQQQGFDRLLRLFEILDHLGERCDKAHLIASPRSEESQQSPDGAYRGVIEYISHNFHHNITLDELAKHSGMNRTALCRHFRNHANRSIFDFLLEFRINYAKQQLITTTRPIAQIAQESGFNNLPHFNVQFKRLTEVTPREYRLKNR